MSKQSRRSANGWKDELKALAKALGQLVTDQTVSGRTDLVDELVTYRTRLKTESVKRDRAHSHDWRPYPESGSDGKIAAKRIDYSSADFQSWAVNHCYDAFSDAADAGAFNALHLAEMGRAIRTEQNPAHAMMRCMVELKIHTGIDCFGPGQAVLRLAAAIVKLSNGKASDRGEANSVPRRGRLTKTESESLRATMLATIKKHPTLANDIPKLAAEVGVHKATIRRWLEAENKRYREITADRAKR